MVAEEVDNTIQMGEIYWRETNNVIAVDGAIHRAAGPMLKEENRDHQGCEEGEAVVSGGYRLPAKCDYSVTLITMTIISITRRHLHSRSSGRTPRGPAESLQKLPHKDAGVRPENNCKFPSSLYLLIEIFRRSHASLPGSTATQTTPLAALLCRPAKSF